MKDNHLERFDEIAKQLCELHRKKDAAYGNSFGETFKKLGIVSAATRLSDKFNRFINLVTHKDVDTLGESKKDTLMDMAAYCIMTLVEMENFQDEVNEWGKKFERLGKKNASQNPRVGNIYCCTRDSCNFTKGKLYKLAIIHEDLLCLDDGLAFLSLPKKDLFDLFVPYEQGNKNNGDSQD